ncbi:MAG: glycosyltransferase family 4 protein [Candidatus Jorgensenbacteria bacterium]|nr:glycosyltransferase family 4 protein [Candidatus Jorgensenbacteria bacterium]
MKVAVTVPGRFWLFYLAQQLLKRGYLEQLITSYPKFEVKKYGIPKEKVSSILIKEILFRGWHGLPGFLRNAYNPQYFIQETFDYFACRALRKADIVAGGSSSFLRTLRKAKKFGAITIVEHGSSHIVYQNNILKEEYERFGIKVEPVHQKVIEKEVKEYEEADYIAIPSFFVKKTFLEKGIPESKIIHVPYGADLSQFHQIPKTDNVFRVIFAGGMSLRKGVHYLLQAFSELNLPNSELMLIGSFNDEIKPFFKKYATAFRRGPAESGKGKIIWMGHIQQKELHKYYSQGSVFAIMSIEEGLALVQPQAMACGLPIIATTNTGAEDIVRDGQDGFIIPIRDIEALKTKLLYLYENRDICKKMGESAKARVSSGFTWDDYGNRMVSEYERILAKNAL